MQGLECGAVDVQRTLCEFSALTVAKAIQQYASDADELVLCGGGTHNPLLCQRIDELLPGVQLKTSDAYGISPDWIESAMMAWLAHRALNRLPGNVPAVTGASRELVLGTVYPA
jgi:anhydro-N-acetylmuramic acid kinase